MRAILINPVSRTIKEVIYSGDYKEITQIIQAESGLFDIVNVQTGSEAQHQEHTDLYIDDEGLLYHEGNPHGYFEWREPGTPEPKTLNDKLILAGLGLILACDAEGETVETNTTVEWVAARVHWLPPGVIITVR